MEKGKERTEKGRLKKWEKKWEKGQKDVQIMWSGLSRVPTGHPCGSTPHLKQDIDYVTQGKPASVVRRGRVRGNWIAYLG